MSVRAPTAMRIAIGPSWRYRVWLALAVGVAFAPVARAQRTDLWVPAQGHGSMSVAYQHLYVRYHTDPHGNKALPGTMRLRSVFLDLDYGLTDRLAINARMAFKSNKYDARIPGSGHDPGSLDDPHGEHFLDDGDYHGGWQDWNVALRYRWIDRPLLTVTPYIAYGQPIRDYTVFAHSAAGTGQRQLEAGANVGGRFKAPAQNLIWRVGAAYAYMEKEGDRRVNHATFDAELGYLLTPRLAVRGVIVKRKTYNGLNFPDYNSHTDDAFFHHDQNIRDDFLNIGASVDYQFNDRYTGFANVGRTLRGDNTHLIDYALTIGISRGF
jgi:hypothetical protein